MRQNIFSRIGKDKEIFRDERFLYPDFLPERLPHRDREIEELAFALKPVVQGRRPENVFVFGKTGTGKTVTVKYVLKELSEYSDRAKVLFVNCFEFNSRHAILSQLSNALGAVVPRRGTGSDEIIERILAVLKRTEIIPIIVLDEADQLLRNSEGSRLFYDLLRGIEMSSGRIGIVFISNDFELPAKLDDRVRSSLAEKRLEFVQYSPPQLKDILSERAGYAFMPGILDKGAIDIVTAHAAMQGGDARLAIECLLKAGRLAEKENSGKVKAEHARKAAEAVQNASQQKALPFASDAEKGILALLEGKELSSGQLYSAYRKHSGNSVTLRRFREIVNEMEAKKLISTRPVALKGRGRTRMISKT